MMIGRIVILLTISTSKRCNVPVCCCDILFFFHLLLFSSFFLCFSLQLSFENGYILGPSYRRILQFFCCNYNSSFFIVLWCFFSHSNGLFGLEGVWFDVTLSSSLLQLCFSCEEPFGSFQMDMAPKKCNFKKILFLFEILITLGSFSLIRIFIFSHYLWLWFFVVLELKTPRWIVGIFGSTVVVIGDLEIRLCFGGFRVYVDWERKREYWEEGPKIGRIAQKEQQGSEDSQKQGNIVYSILKIGPEEENAEENDDSS